MRSIVWCGVGQDLGKIESCDGVVGVRRLPVSAGGDHAGGPLVSTLRAFLSRLEELLTEHGVDVDHVTLYRWVQHFTPILIDASGPCRYAVSDRWYVDETYVKVSGAWRYVYRAVDHHGQVIDVFVSTRRTLAPRDTSSPARSVTTVNPARLSPTEQPHLPKRSPNWHRTRCTPRSSTPTTVSKPITAA